MSNKYNINILRKSEKFIVDEEIRVFIDGEEIKSETSKLTRMLGWGAGIATLAAEFGIPTIVAAVLGMGAVYVDWINSLGGDKGVSLKQNWIGYAWLDYNR